MNAIRRRRTLAICGLLCFGWAGVASAQATLPVDVDITIDPEGSAIFNYFESIDVTVSPADLAELQNAAWCAPASGVLSLCGAGTAPARDATTDNGGSLASDLAADFDLTIPAATGLAAVRLDLDNVWAVRATGGDSTDTTVAITLTGASTTLTNGTSTILILQADLYLMNGSGVPQPSKTFPDPGMLVPVLGGVQLKLDMDDALDAGTYSTAADTGDTNYLIGITST